MGGLNLPISKKQTHLSHHLLSLTINGCYLSHYPTLFKILDFSFSWVSPSTRLPFLSFFNHNLNLLLFLPPSSPSLTSLLPDLFAPRCQQPNNHHLHHWHSTTPISITTNPPLSTSTKPITINLHPTSSINLHSCHPQNLEPINQTQPNTFQLATHHRHKTTIKPPNPHQ